MQQRPLQINDNVVFLYDPTFQFTSDDPFPSICDITHIRYRLIASSGGVYYFDKVGVLCKLVSSILLPPKIKLEYDGTYLLFSPPTASLIRGQLLMLLYSSRRVDRVHRPTLHQRSQGMDNPQHKCKHQHQQQQYWLYCRTSQHRKCCLRQQYRQRP